MSATSSDSQRLAQQWLRSGGFYAHLARDPRLTVDTAAPARYGSRTVIDRWAQSCDFSIWTENKGFHGLTPSVHHPQDMVPATAGFPATANGKKFALRYDPINCSQCAGVGNLGPCWHCRGTKRAGFCTSCSGKGFTTRYSELLNTVTIEGCSFCGRTGKGRCHACDATGKSPCYGCNGAGGWRRIVWGRFTLNAHHEGRSSHGNQDDVPDSVMLALPATRTVQPAGGVVHYDLSAHGMGELLVPTHYPVIEQRSAGYTLASFQVQGKAHRACWLDSGKERRFVALTKPQRHPLLLGLRTLLTIAMVALLATLALHQGLHSTLVASRVLALVQLAAAGLCVTSAMSLAAVRTVWTREARRRGADAESAPLAKAS